MSDNTNHIRISDTNTENVHGNTIIKPGDVVEYKNQWCRVIEVNPDETEDPPNNNYLFIYKSSGIHKSTERIHAEAVTGYKSRDKIYSKNQ